MERKEGGKLVNKSETQTSDWQSLHITERNPVHVDMRMPQLPSEQLALHFISVNQFELHRGMVKVDQEEEMNLYVKGSLNKPTLTF